MKIGAAFVAAALFVTLAACGGAPTAVTPSAADGTNAGSSNAGSSNAANNADQASPTDQASDSSEASDSTDSDDAPVVENAESSDESSSQESDAASGSDAADDTGGAAAGDAGAAKFCTDLIAAEKKLDDVQKSFAGGDLKAVGAALGAQVGVFQQLAASAPDQIKPAMADIVTVLQTGEKALTGATPDPQALANMGTYLPGDMAALGNYVSENCASVAGG